jgi:hypothetical protein
VATVGDVLSSLNISFLVDDSNNSIGRRYARTDEIGLPFAITVENTLGVSGTVTLRDRDTCGQVCGVMKAQGGFQGGPLLSSGQRWPGQPNSTPPHVSCVRFPFLPPPPPRPPPPPPPPPPPQVRLPLADLAAVVQQLCEQRLAFADLMARFVSTRGPVSLDPHFCHVRGVSVSTK